MNINTIILLPVVFLSFLILNMHTIIWTNYYLTVSFCIDGDLLFRTARTGYIDWTVPLGFRRNSVRRWIWPSAQSPRLGSRLREKSGTRRRASTKCAADEDRVLQTASGGTAGPLRFHLFPDVLHGWQAARGETTEGSRLWRWSFLQSGGRWRQIYPWRFYEKKLFKMWCE